MPSFENWLAAHGLPTQLGLSDGAIGAATNGASTSVGDIIRGVGNAASKIPGLTGTTGGTGGSSGGGGLLGGGGTYQMQPYKSLTAILRNYGLLGMPNG